MRFRIVMDHDKFTSAINFPFMRKSDLSPKLIFDELSKVIQSKKKDNLIDSTNAHLIKLSLIKANVVSGSGKRKQPDV